MNFAGTTNYLIAVALLRPMKSGITFPPDTSFNETAGRPIWTKPIKPWGAAYRAGEELLDEERYGEVKWQPEELPPGIKTFNFTSVENGMLRIVSSDDGWKADCLTEPCVDLELQPNCATDLRDVDIWRPSDVPSIIPGPYRLSGNI